jgi:hypothetical protein
MSDTIVTVGVSPSTQFDSSIGYSAMSVAAANQVPAGPAFLQYVIPYSASPQFAIDCANVINSYIDKNGIQNPKTLKDFAANVGNFCSADRILIQNPKANVYDAMINNNRSKYDYITMQMKQMSGDSTTPITAWANFLWGDGSPRTVNLPDVGLRIQPNQISPLMDIVGSGAVGTFAINSKFTRDTMLDGIIPASYLGYITLHTTGTLTINSLGAWNYTGTVKAYNDIYDANPSTHRGQLGEISTQVLRHFTGKPYEIEMPGSIPVKGTGMR